MKVLLVHHAGLQQHALHAFYVTHSLTELGVDAIQAVTANAALSEKLGRTKVKVIEFPQAYAGEFGFEGGGGPDLVHVWTPREISRELAEHVCERFGCPYIVHLEDNEWAVTEDELFDHRRRDWSGVPRAMIDVLIASHRTHPVRGRRFLDRAAGATVLMDRLAEHLAEGTPRITFWPGYDAEFENPPQRSAARAAFGLTEDEIALVYTGNIHSSNFREIQSLALGAALAKRAGVKLKLLRTGLNYAPAPWEVIEELKPVVVELGFLERSRMPELLAAADLLVQPGEANRFNDYRFPSKLPEFMAAGRAIILPRSNLGRFLKDRENALVLESGRATELAERICELAGDRGLRERLGAAGREFALKHLNWDKNVPAVRDFYEKILATKRHSGNGHGFVADRYPSDLPAKLIAFYLPQFHPIPENDRWWGEGFTEWTNVKRARPNFAGHEQPLLPGELGHYDLRDRDVMERQAKLAREHGIFGFCYYYYWFNGKRLLETPIDRMLAEGKPAFPFCLCWANENWTRRWDGLESEVLMRQEYSDDADERFIRDVLPFLKDTRYIRVDGKAMLLVYRVDQLPDAKRTAAHWRQVAKEEGVDLHLVMVQSFGVESDPRAYDFDAAVEFPPHRPHRVIEHENWPGLDAEFDGFLEDYRQMVEECVSRAPTGHGWYRGVMPGWDNTPRRQGKAHVYVNSRPEIYEAWVRHSVAQAMGQPGQAPIVFVNSWNEWAEGAQLEPDEKNGRARLNATLRGLAEGIADYGRERGFKANADLIAANIVRMAGSPVSALSDIAVSPAACVSPEPLAPPPKGRTALWFEPAAIKAVAKQYIGKYKTESLSYATVRDYCDSFDNLQPLATANHDLKDVQRPWIFKAILGNVPAGGRLLEIGAGEPLVADLLQQLGYEVWVVDPYDGTGNGPKEFEAFRAQYPKVKFVRDLFSDRLQIPSNHFDCIYSISVLEHVPTEFIGGLLAGLKKFLKPGGLNLHAIDHVHMGNGAEEHLAKLKKYVEGFGLDVEGLKKLLMEKLPRDPDVYYLSAEAHNGWRGNRKYSEFPMRVCISVQTCGRAQMVRVP
jgi:glycosyltransferase involved in cell wall biosynthesis